MYKCRTPRQRAIAKLTSGRMSPLKPQLLEPDYTPRHRSYPGESSRIRCKVVWHLHHHSWTDVLFGVLRMFEARFHGTRAKVVFISFPIDDSFSHSAKFR